MVIAILKQKVEAAGYSFNSSRGLNNRIFFFPSVLSAIRDILAGDDVYEINAFI